MLLNHIVYADSGRTLFTRLSKKDHIAIEWSLHPVQQQEDLEAGSCHALIVRRPASVDIAILDRTAKRVDGPFVSLDPDNVDVTH